MKKTSEGDSSPASKHEDAPDGEIQTLFEGTFDDVVCQQEVILDMLGSRKHFACFCSLFFSFQLSALSMPVYISFVFDEAEA